jgi:diguanylate cyclase (GGDEF)-like protein
MERKAFAVLLVEDSPMDARLLRESLRDALERGELALHAVRSIGEAVEELGRNRYACALLDLGLPDGQGLANVEKLRELDRSMTVVVLTGLDCESSAIRALQLGAQEYVVKGQYDGDSLLKVIRHASERNRQLHELEAQRARQFEQASNDAVTGLASRKLFEDKTRQLLAVVQGSGRRFAMCFLDLDRFKAVNDRHGHAVGDGLLARVAQILRESVRDSDTVARLGGDEFAILLPSIGEAAMAREIGRRIVERIRGIEAVENHPVGIGCSFGVALYPDHGSTMVDLLYHSDMAMYRAKSEGGGVVVAGDEAGRRPVLVGAGLAASVAEAFANGEFEMYFQPWIDFPAQRFAGVEALIRWRRPEGLLTSVEFLQVLEDSGRMPEIGLGMARGALHEWRSWRNAGLIPGVLALNLSRSELLSADHLPRLQMLVAEEGLTTAEVQLEVDAAVLMASGGRIEATLEAYGAAGFRIVLEGLSPPENGDLPLMTLPVLSAIKLDRSLLRKTMQEGRSSKAGRFTAATLGAAAGLGLPVFLTGIESAEDLQSLRTMNFRYLQGQWLCPPLPAADVAAHLKQGPRWLQQAPADTETTS